MLNPIAAGLRNPTKLNIKVQLSIPAGAPLDDVADQLIAAGLRVQAEPPAFLLEHTEDEADDAKPEKAAAKSRGKAGK